MSNKVFEYKNGGIEYKFEGYNVNDIKDIVSFIEQREYKQVELSSVPPVIYDDIESNVDYNKEYIRIPNNYDENGIEIGETIMTNGLTCPDCNQSFIFCNEYYNYFYIKGEWYFSTVDEMDVIFDDILDKEDRLVKLNDLYNDLCNLVESNGISGVEINKIGKKIDIFNNELTCPVCRASHTVKDLAVEYKLCELKNNGHCIVCSSDLSEEEYESKSCLTCGREIDWIEE